MSEYAAAMRRSALALAAAAMTIGACSLGLRESQVGEPPTGGGSTQSASSTPGNGGSTATSTATSGVLCGDGTCDRPVEDCSSCPGDCPCFSGTGCKAGKCDDCPATFAVDVPNTLATHGIAASKGKLYLAPTLGSGMNTNASLVEVDACFGALATTTVHAASGAASSGGRVALGGAGAEVVAACGFKQSATDDAALIFGGGDGPVPTWQVQKNPSSGDDSLVDIAAAGDVWMACGSRVATPQGWILYGDLKGQRACTIPSVFSDTEPGVAMASDGTKLYVAASDGGSISIATYDASACHPASCNAPPPAHYVDSITVGQEVTQVGAMLFAGGQLYVAGLASNGSGAYFAYVTTVDPTTGTKSATPYTSTPDGLLSEFVSLAYDGTLVYAGGYEGVMMLPDFGPAKGVVVGLQPQLGAMPAFVVHPKDAHSVVGVATDTTQPGVFFASADKSPGAAVYRCKSSSTACP